MKTLKIFLVGIAAILVTVVSIFTLTRPKHAEASAAKGCVFRTVFGEDASDNMYLYNTPENVTQAIDHALDWTVKAQQDNGGWGAGSHSRQGVMDPHAVQADPATTSMVCMALLRSGSTLTLGRYSDELKKGLNFILEQVENSGKNSNTITSLTGTQIQSKLGNYIDVVLASQFLTNVLDYSCADADKNRIKNALQVCVDKIQRTQNTNGSFSGNGWAGVLQSSFATSALESAQHVDGIKTRKEVLEKSREYQAGNYDEKTGEVNTDLGAGVVLYSVSSSVRNTSVDAKKVKEDIAQAKKDGKIANTEKEVTPEVLQKIGYSRGEADKYSTAYNVYNSAKATAQQDKVMNGFGSNGGEEFMSYLQTGESMIINKDNDWKKWYDNISGKLVSIQNNDGSWNGHHCITSPVFCTATSLLILSVNNDVSKLMQVGSVKQK
jgi:hypothetical protein